MTTRLSRITVPALSLTLALALTGCGDDGEDDSSANSNAEAATSENAPDVENTEAPSDDNTAEGDTGDSNDSGADDVTAGALQAIATAEAEAGGVAYAIDDEDDDQSWEVDVFVDDRGVEVTVSADGTEVRETENDDLDDDDRAGITQAEISITEAIDTAAAEVGGTLDDAELDDEDDRFAWEVTVDTSDRDDIEVYVDIVNGSVLNVDRD